MSDTAEQSLDHATEADLGDAVETGAHVAAEHEHGAQYNTRVTLKKPIQRQSADMPQVGALYLREPTAGDLRGGGEETSIVTYELLGDAGFKSKTEFGWEHSARRCEQSSMPADWRENDISDVIG